MTTDLTDEVHDIDNKVKTIIDGTKQTPSSQLQEINDKKAQDIPADVTSNLEVTPQQGKDKAIKADNSINREQQIPINNTIVTGPDIPKSTTNSGIYTTPRTSEQTDTTVIQPTVTHTESKQQSNKQNTSSQERQDSDKKNHDKQAETAAVDNTVKQPKDSNTTPANSQAVDDDKLNQLPIVVCKRLVFTVFNRGCALFTRLIN